MGPDGTLAPDWDDEIVTGMCVLREGQPMAPAAVELLGGAGGAGTVIANLMQSTWPSTGRRPASSST